MCQEDVGLLARWRELGLPPAAAQAIDRLPQARELEAFVDRVRELTASEWRDLGGVAPLATSKDRLAVVYRHPDRIEAYVALAQLAERAYGRQTPTPSHLALSAIYNAAAMLLIDAVASAEYATIIGRLAGGS